MYSRALSVPTAFAAAIGGLSGRGILVRGSSPLERAGQVSTVVLDKTGTVTLATPKVVGIESYGVTASDELLRIAASVESGFNHPIANAIIAYAAAEGVQPLTTEGSTYLPGLGIKSCVSGREVVLGSTETVTALGMRVPPGIRCDGRPTWIGIDGETAGAFVIQDILREDAHGIGDTLRDLGVQRVLLATGDNEAAEAQRVAGLIKADGWRHGLTSEDKIAWIKELRAQGPTAMVGDGVNDATSLAIADVGISIGRTKADLAIRASDIVVLKEEAAGIGTVIGTGKHLVRIIRQNYAWAVVFNLNGIALATAGVLSSWLAALLHHVSSVLVVFNSARLLHHGS